MSINEHRQAARRQGFYFFVEEILPQWEQFGGVHWSDLDSAMQHAKDTCRQFRIFKVFYNAEIPSIQVH